MITDAQARGFGLQLWREGSQYFGFFLSAAGLAEDIPLGVLEDLKFDPATRAFSFSAKMTLGGTTTNDKTWVPTRDLYRFEGTLFPDQVSGTLTHSDPHQPDLPPKSEAIKLYRAREEEAAMPRPSSYAVWSSLAQKLLKTRGPKWQ